MKKFNMIIIFGTLFTVGQEFGVSQQEKDTWKANIDKIMTDNCINDKGLVDPDTMDKLIDYAGSIIASQTQDDAFMNAFMKREWLGEFFKRRLNDIRLKKGVNKIILITEIPQNRIAKWKEGVDKVIKDNWLNIKMTPEGRADRVALAHYWDAVFAVTEPEFAAKVFPVLSDFSKKRREEIEASQK